jgi:hypothetical protein
MRQREADGERLYTARQAKDVEEDQAGMTAGTPMVITMQQWHRLGAVEMVVNQLVA